MAAVPVAVGDGVGAERGGGSVGLRQGVVPVGACHATPFAKICVLLEAPQTSRPASQQGEYHSFSLCIDKDLNIEKLSHTFFSPGLDFPGDLFLAVVFT